MRHLTLIFTLVITLSTAMIVHAEPQVFTGTLDGDHPTFVTRFDLKAGDLVIITANATSGGLDTYLSLSNPAGVVVAENDDRNYHDQDSALGYTAKKDGTYTITLSRFDDEGGGDYRLNIEVGDISLLDALDTQPGEIRLSGPMLSLDTAHFRIHYTLRGLDATTEDYVRDVAKTMETVWQVEVHDMGWPAPPDDGRGGGDSRFDIYLTDMLDEDGYGALGAARPGFQYGDNPATAAIEHYATSTMIRLDNDFSEIENEDESVSDLLRVTAAHEFHHAIQHGYDQEDLLWYYETTSVWMETQVFPKIHDAENYLEYTDQYPELCFGTEDDPENGLLMYGEWPIIQSFVDRYGQKMLFQLWSNIAQYDGFAALEQTLAFYGDTVPEALARYRIQNLVRDYSLAPEFGTATPWLSDDIVRAGRINGYGAQELGANYIGFRPAAGTYSVNIVDNPSLELWAVGLHGNQADAINLGQGGTISNAHYDYTYLMVFNPAYDDLLDDCTTAHYQLETRPSSAALTPVTETWDAQYFLPLQH